MGVDAPVKTQKNFLKNCKGPLANLIPASRRPRVLGVGANSKCLVSVGKR